MKKKLLILVCLVFAIGTYVAVTGVQNSVLIQNVLANGGGSFDIAPGPTPDSDTGGGGGGFTGTCAPPLLWQLRDSLYCKLW